MFVSSHTDWIIQGQSALLALFITRSLQEIKWLHLQIGKARQKAMLLVISFGLLSCFLETHQSITEGLNSCCGWGKQVCTYSSCPLSYLAIQARCLFLPIPAHACSHSVLLLASQYLWFIQIEKKKKFIQVWVKKGILWSWLRWRWGIHGWFYLQLYSLRKIIFVGGNSCQLNNKAVVLLGSRGCIFILVLLTSFVYAVSLTSPTWVLTQLTEKS